MTLNLTRRAVKGSPLDTADHDGNLTKLEAGVLAGAVASVTALRALTGAYDGQVAHVVDQRQFGHFKWTAGDLSAFVTADPHSGIYVAPTAAATGASGAWVRQVERGEYDAEWWLPDAMPANAQVRLATIFANLPATARRLLFPRREVTVTGTVILTAGIEYVGGGRAAPFNGGGGGFFPVTIAASNAKLFDISSGNVTGTAVQGEPGGFHISDGLAFLGSLNTNPIENVSVRDCHGFNARTGIRVGYKSTGTGSASTSTDTVVYGSRDIYIENFHCDGIDRIGIETMRAHGVEVVGGVLRMLTDSSAGIKRGVRIAGAHNVTLMGTRIVGAGVVPVSGVSVELAANGSSNSGCSDITINSVVCENCLSEGFRVDRRSANVTIANSKAVGRQDTLGTFIRLTGDVVAGNEIRSIAVRDCDAVNIEEFCRIGGRIVGLIVNGNTHISNSSSVARFFISSGSAINDELVEGVFVGNRGVATTGAGGYFRYIGMSGGSTITLDDNEFTPDAAGNIFTFTGDGVVRMKRRDSNRVLPPELWAAIRPALDLEEYV